MIPGAEVDFPRRFETAKLDPGPAFGTFTGGLPRLLVVRVLRHLQLETGPGFGPFDNDDERKPSRGRVLAHDNFSYIATFVACPDATPLYSTDEDQREF